MRTWNFGRAKRVHEDVLRAARPPATVRAMRLTNLGRAALIGVLGAALVPGARADGAATAIETPNRALRFELPPGWTARALGNGLALDPPAATNGKKGPADESIVVGCEPFHIKSLAEEAKVEDLLGRLRAGQLASCDLDRRWHRDRVKVGDATALVVSYEGTDDSGMPAALRVAILPDDGRVGVLTARMPLVRMTARAKELDAILASMRIAPLAEAQALAARLAGAWRSAAAPGVRLVLKKDGTFEETRVPPPQPEGVRTMAQQKGGMIEVIGREVRLRFDDGSTRSFVVEDEPAPGQFRSAGQLWTRDP